MVVELKFDECFGDYGLGISSLPGWEGEGPVQSEVLIIYYILLMVTRILTTNEMEKFTTADTYPYNTKAMATTTNIKKHINEGKHIQLATLHRIWTNIRTARIRIKKQSDTIRHFYSKVHLTLNGGFVYEWLPKEHLQMFENKIRHLDKHIKVSTMLPILYSSVEMFLSTFEEMLTFDSTDQHIVQVSVYKTRQSILDRIITDLKSTLVEVKSGLDAFKLKKNVTEVADMKNSRRQWEFKADHTFVMIQDWGVITMYYKFVKDWEKITRVIFENYCHTAHKGHRCHKSLKSDFVT